MYAIRHRAPDAAIPMLARVLEAVGWSWHQRPQAGGAVILASRTAWRRMASHGITHREALS